LVERAEGSSGSTAGTAAEIIFTAVPVLCGVFTAVILFFLLLVRRRIDLVSGAWLGALLLVVATVPTLAADWTWMVCSRFSAPSSSPCGHSRSGPRASRTSARLNRG